MSKDETDARTEAWTPEQRAGLRDQGLRRLEEAAADDDNRTVPLTAEMRAELRATGLKRLAEQDAARAPAEAAAPSPFVPTSTGRAALPVGAAPVGAAPVGAAPVAAAPVGADPGRTEHLTPELREQLRREGMARLGPAAAPSTMGDPSAGPAEANTDPSVHLPPGHVPALAPSDEGAPTTTPPGPTPAPAGPGPTGPGASPTHFDIEVNTNLWRGGAPPPGATPDAVPPTGFEVPGTEHDPRAHVAKTAFVDMRRELSQGTGLIKAMLAIAVGVAIAIAILILLS